MFHQVFQRSTWQASRAREQSAAAEITPVTEQAQEAASNRVFVFVPFRSLTLPRISDR